MKMYLFYKMRQDSINHFQEKVCDFDITTLSLRSFLSLSYLRSYSLWLYSNSVFVFSYF